jgi:hypothetical protein
MRRPGVGFSCALVVLFLTGCSHLPGVSDVVRNGLSSNAQKTPAEDTKAQVCILDPAAYTAEAPAQPVPESDCAPAVELPETTYDFGKLAESGELVHKFNVKNVGKCVLNIKKVLPG